MRGERRYLEKKRSLRNKVSFEVRRHYFSSLNISLSLFSGYVICVCFSTILKKIEKGKVSEKKSKEKDKRNS